MTGTFDDETFPGLKSEARKYGAVYGSTEIGNPPDDLLPISPPQSR